MSCPTSLSSFLGESREGDCYLSLSLNSLSPGPLLDTYKVNPANPPTLSSPFILHNTGGAFSMYGQCQTLWVRCLGLVESILNQYLVFSHHVSSHLSPDCATCPSNPSTTRSFTQPLFHKPPIVALSLSHHRLTLLSRYSTSNLQGLS